MLKQILTRLNGHGSDPAALGDALDQLRRDRADVRSALSELRKKRHAALLADAPDAEIDKIDREIERAEIRVEKLAVAEPALIERIVVAQADVRGVRWKALHARHQAAAAEFLKAARAAAAAHDALIEIVNQAQREGFGRDATVSMPPTPNVAGNAVLAPDLLDAFASEIERANGAKPARAAREPITPATKPALRSLQRAVRLGDPGDAMVRRQGLVNDDAPLAAGEARVRVTRPGYTDANGAQRIVGDVIRLPAEIAKAAASHAAVEIIEGASQ